MLSPTNDFDRLIHRHRLINASETSLRRLLNEIGEDSGQPEEKQIKSEQR
jgi:hypothetical protein